MVRAVVVRGGMQYRGYRYAGSVRTEEAKEPIGQWNEAEALLL